MLVTLSRRFGKELELLAMVPAGNNVIKTAFTAQKMKFTIKDIFSKCGQIRGKLRIWSHLLKKFLRWLAWLI